MFNIAALDFLREAPVSRRNFVIGATAVGAGLVVGFRAVAEEGATASGSAPNPFAGYIQIDPDNKVTIFSAHMDMGQGSYQGVATLAMEELDADWTKLDVVGAAGNPALY